MSLMPIIALSPCGRAAHQGGGVSSGLARHGLVGKAILVEYSRPALNGNANGSVIVVVLAFDVCNGVRQAKHGTEIAWILFFDSVT